MFTEHQYIKLPVHPACEIQEQYSHAEWKAVNRDQNTGYTIVAFHKHIYTN